MAHIAVVGRDGRLLFGPAAIGIDGINDAMAALNATGLHYTLSSRYPGVVESIASQRNEGQAGWEYKVNNEVPGVPASSAPLRRGDRLIWWYSGGHGSPAPNWESLG